MTEAYGFLERTPVVVEDLVGALPQHWIKCNEGGDTWSVYDVVGHLIHGEKTDWIPRAKIILSERPQKDFEPFDRFAQQRESEDKSLNDLLTEFKSLRQQNLLELQKLKITEDQLQLTGIHPEFGEVTLRQLLATWVAHDLGHIGQIVRVLGKQYKEEVGPWIKYLGYLTRY